MPGWRTAGACHGRRHDSRGTRRSGRPPKRNRSPPTRACAGRGEGLTEDGELVAPTLAVRAVVALLGGALLQHVAHVDGHHVIQPPRTKRPRDAVRPEEPAKLRCCRDRTRSWRPRLAPCVRSMRPRRGIWDSCSCPRSTKMWMIPTPVRRTPKAASPFTPYFSSTGSPEAMTSHATSYTGPSSIRLTRCPRPHPWRGRPSRLPGPCGALRKVLTTVPSANVSPDRYHSPIASTTSRMHNPLAIHSFSSANR